MENNREFMNANTGEQCNEQCNGLKGLGPINNKTMSFESSTFETQETNPDCLVVDRNKFDTLDSYYMYLRQWFNSTGVVNVQDTTESVKSKTKYAYMFDIGFPNSNNRTHAVIACRDIDAAKYFLSNCKNGKFSDPALMFCFYNFDNSDKRIAANNNIELVGISEMHEINDAITSVFGGLTIGNTLLGRLQKSLREKFKNQKPIADTAQSSLNNTGDELMSALNDGFDQLKNSLAAVFSAVGAGKLANSVGTVGNPFGNNANAPKETFETFGETPSGPNTTVVDTTVNTAPSVFNSVNLEKETVNTTENVEVIETVESAGVNLKKDDESDESVPQGTSEFIETEVVETAPHVSLAKTEDHSDQGTPAVQTTDNVIEQPNNTINSAEDFLKIEN